MENDFQFEWDDFDTIGCSVSELSDIARTANKKLQQWLYSAPTVCFSEQTGAWDDFPRGEIPTEVYSASAKLVHIQKLRGWGEE